jgi:GNAT superfamily N-acetyltransferase
MIIRDAKSIELPFIRKQRVYSYEGLAQNIPDEHWQALKQAISSDKDAQPGVEQIVAELEGTIIGSIVLFPANTLAYKGYMDELEYPEIRMLAVIPEARGKGVATALVHECIRRAKVKGYQSIGLHTADYMESAVRLYERLGFKRLPQFDFQPTNDGITVKAYLLSFDY